MAGSSVQEKMMGLMNKLFAQSQAMEAWPTLYTATAPDVHGGEYFGPDGFMEQRGYPTKCFSNIYRP